MRRIAKLEQTLKELLAIATTHFADQLGGRAGGWFCMLSPITKQVLNGFHFPIGTIPPEKDNRCKGLSFEKALRLSQHRNHLSSWQSRKPEVSMYGGAIRGYNYLFSFSGLPEIWDEALMLTLAFIHEEIDFERAMAIVAESENPYFELLIEAHKKITQQVDTPLTA